MNYLVERPHLVVVLSSVLFFLLALLTECACSRFFRRQIYAVHDSIANLAMYAGSLLIDFLWIPVVFAIYTFLHRYSFTKFGYQWWLFQGTTPLWHWILLLFADDLCFYLFHRTSHHVWILWASHENHHSSARFNLSVAARQTWTPFLAFLFWLPLVVIGFDPLMVLTMQLMSLSYQALLHTELVKSFGPLDRILNSPSHHRVHHGLNERYLNKNFGGIFIFWDRLFGTFIPEKETVRYGTGEAFRGYEPVKMVFGEWIKLFRSLRRQTLGQAVKIALLPPR